MLWMLSRLLGGGALERALSIVDRRVAAETDKDRIKAELIAEHLRSRPDFMRAGGFFLMAIFAVPLAVWFSAVCVYSMLFCRLCIWPQAWSIAALPAPLDSWSGAMVTAIFGVVGLTNLRR
jgi:hypothetical protein